MVNSWDEYMKEVRKDNFQVVIKLIELPNRLRLTYTNKKSNNIIMIEELDGDKILSSGMFKGTKTNGPDWMIDVKKAFNDMKAGDWILNTCYVDCYSLKK